MNQEGGGIECKPIVLVGLMGCGKSAVGRKLAACLSRTFYDTDHAIEQEQGETIAQIFDRHGEPYFRRLEKDKIEVLLCGQTGYVISTGGGAVTVPETLSLIKDKALSVWLNTDVQTLCARLKNDQTRPLLQGQNLESVLTGLLTARQALYSQADIHIDSSGNVGDIDRVVETIIKEIERHSRV